MRPSMAPRRTSGSGAGFGFGVETQPSTLASGLTSTPSRSASTLPAPAHSSASAPAPASGPASTPTSASSFLHRSSRPPALSTASLFSASAASPASGPASSSAPQRLSFSSSSIPPSPAAASPSASAFAPASIATPAAASAAAPATALPSPFSSSTARPILPPLPPLPQASPLSRYLSERPHLSNLTPSRSFPVSLEGITTLQPDPYSPLNSPFSHYPRLLGSQATFWSNYRRQLDRPHDWLQDESAAANVNVGVLAARAFGFNLSGLPSPFTPFTSQPPLLQSPSHRSRRSPDLRFPFDSGNSPASPPAPAPTSAASLTEPSASAASASAASASTSASAAPSSRHLYQTRAARTASTGRISATAAYNSASPPASGQGNAPLPNSAEAAFDSDNTTLDEIYYDLDGFPGFPLPVAETADTTSSSAFAAMPAASRRSLRNRVPTAEGHDPSASTTNASKRRRISPSAAQPTSQETVIDDDDVENWGLFGSSPPRPGSSSDLKNEEYTTIDLTEVNDVPEDLKKPEVDNRVKLSAFQCVICMDDVTGLTLTHCGHLFCAQCLYSSLSIESTRGKCPMCRAKIDMKPRENYTVKTKGYWPLELKLMTRTRQGKRKAQAME
ncbi:hypothetical protein V8C35DRAFT_167537 [Trichoderma chlorosporum]